MSLGGEVFSMRKEWDQTNPKSKSEYLAMGVFVYGPISGGFLGMLVWLLVDVIILEPVYYKSGEQFEPFQVAIFLLFIALGIAFWLSASIPNCNTMVRVLIPAATILLGVLFIFATGYFSSQASTYKTLLSQNNKQKATAENQSSQTDGLIISDSYDLSRLTKVSLGDLVYYVPRDAEKSAGKYAELLPQDIFYVCENGDSLVEGYCYGEYDVEPEQVVIDTHRGLSYDDENYKTYKGFEGRLVSSQTVSSDGRTMYLNEFIFQYDGVLYGIDFYTYEKGNKKIRNMVLDTLSTYEDDCKAAQDNELLEQAQQAHDRQMAEEAAEHETQQCTPY